VAISWTLPDQRPPFAPGYCRVQDPGSGTRAARLRNTLGLLQD